MNLTRRRADAPTKVKLDCFDCQSRDRSAWCGLNLSDVSFLNEHKQAQIVRPGSVIHEQGDACKGVYIVERGTVAIRKTDAAGNTMLLRLCHKGDTIGYRALLSGEPHTTSAECLAESRVCFVAKESVQAMTKRNPELGLQFVRQLAQELEATEHGLLRTAALPIRVRLAHLLLSLRERYGSVDDSGTLLLELPLSRQDIASLLAARPETIARAIHELDSDSVAHFSGRTVTIPDLDLLLDEVEFADAP